jgi:hypothetical protein
MTRRSILWRAAAALFVVINVGGAIFAAAQGEQMHAAAHVGLLLLGATYMVSRRGSRAAREDLLLTPQADDRLSYLQQSVDAIALEVERIGEAQRFNEKLRAQPGDVSSPAKPAAQQGEISPVTKPPGET